MTIYNSASRSNSIPANLRPYVEVLGEDDAMNLFLALGGTTVYLAARPGKNGLLPRTVGPEKTAELATVFGSGYVKVPIARRWIADTLYFRGESSAEIARIIRCDEATVRRWFNA